MSNPPLVKTPLSGPAAPPAPAPATTPAAAPGAAEPAAAAASSTPNAAAAAESKPVPDPAPDPKTAAVMRLLRPVPDPKLHPDAEARLPRTTRIEVMLGAHRLRVLQEDEVLVESPLATGRALSPTPEGTFTLAAKPAVPAALRYGHFRTKGGALLVRGVFPKIDPLPADAVFDQVTPKGFLQLSGEGPMIFGGEATGAATTDGTLVLPDRIALLLHEKLPLGVPVVIAR